MIPIEYILLGSAILIFFSVLSSKITDRFAIPSLLLFLIIGMLAGKEGLGGVEFKSHWAAESIGITALIFIIFTGGLNTHWRDINPILGPGLALSTFGLLFTALILGFFSVIILNVSPLEGFLLGAVLSSTDAAAVFNIFRSRRIGFKGGLRELLEFESGSNDPMAVFLTVGIIGLMKNNAPLNTLIPIFFMEMGAGFILGLLFARATIILVKKIHLQYEGLYPTLILAMVALTYSVTNILHGNGFLAVYILGIVLGSHDFLHKKVLLHFYEGIAWLMQIVMFLALGLLVLPSGVFAHILPGLAIAAVLMFIARPLSVFICLLGFNMSIPKKVMVSWVGLRGAAPIVLATFPLLAGVPHAVVIFNIVFFVVLTSILIQGTSVSLVANWLNVSVPVEADRRHPLEFEKTEAIDAMLTDLLIPYNSQVVGKTIYDLRVPDGNLIVLIARGDKYLVPGGATALQGGDVMLVLAKDNDYAKLRDIVIKLNAATT
jgi:potassium/hydrogen antiporter